ncbi:hypothetical protein NQ317_005526 [Molorchus minor]|uniref:D-2-hydroxyglutarate dehydrogenase, mitochondrial n=1 Tax=Molorchus minor TaxID=1323400 RepID=A0ABQ9J349_9CUCU|nr:hypothetical protein NQ317_005526 [Molorchus minor]
MFYESNKKVNHARFKPQTFALLNRSRKAGIGYSQCVLRPKTTEEVSRILSFCNEHRIAVCPQGGNTGLVGGSVPVFDEVVLSTSLMDQIISTNDTSGVLVCQAGCILEKLDTHLADHGLMMPLDLGAKRFLSSWRQCVKANGEVLDCLRYHLKHLFIGSEGTLGIVTKVAIQCPAKPKAQNVAFLGLESFQDVLKTMKKAKYDLGEILSSCELIDELSLDLVTSHLKLNSPISVYPFYMLIETQGSNNDHDEMKMNAFLESAMSDGLILDGTTTNEVSKMQSLWELRERITEGLTHDGYVFKYDISLPTKNFYSLVPAMKERLGDSAKRICGYGHLGDGNIHLNISVREFTQDILDKIEPFVYEFTSKLKGSISAEHGIGFRKPKYIHYSKSKESIALMKQLKAMMDPNGILNPYKVLPA